MYNFIVLFSPNLFTAKIKPRYAYLNAKIILDGCVCVVARRLPSFFR